jgi:hypothetical protein
LVAMAASDSEWRARVLAARWRKRTVVAAEPVRCGLCQLLKTEAVSMFVDERNAIQLHVCVECEPQLTVIPERRR